jgi:hypothetical protein
MTELYAFILVPLVVTLTVATAWGQTSGRPETVVIRSGPATLHATRVAIWLKMSTARLSHRTELTSCPRQDDRTREDE